MFEKAVRQKIRFDYKGSQSVEDLWDMSLTDLDGLYKNLIRIKKNSDEDSLLNTKTDATNLLDLQIEIVKHIVTVRLQEQDEKKNASKKKAEKEKLLAILAEKQETDLRGKSAEELQKMIDEL